MADNVDETTTVIYIHGYGGANEPGGVADQLAAALGPQFQVKAPVYDPAVPNRVMDMFGAAISEEGQSELVLVGNSLGGFFANYLSLTRKVDALLVNPLLHPASLLRERGIDEAILQQYAALERVAESQRVDAGRIVLVGDADDVVDPRCNGYTLSDRAEVITVPMGHKLTDISKAAELVRRLAYSVTGIFD